MYEYRSLPQPTNDASHVRGPTCPEVPVERITGVTRPSAFDEDARQVRATDGRIARQREDVIERDRDAALVQLRDDLLRANVAALAERAERIFECGGALDVRPSKWTSRSASVALSSTPGTTRTPSCSPAAAASATPAMVS
jgi:hypothetical protein